MVEGPVCIRLHFGMSGSLHLDSSKPRSNRAVLRLCVEFEGGRSFTVYGGDEYGSCGLFDVKVAYFKARGPLKSLDVCGPDFDKVKALERVLEEGDKVICVAIMDQMVLPGVGNIIKQESLHRAGMNPLRKVGDFSEDEIARLVDILRWFSMEWLKGTRPESKVYDRTNCADCGGSVMVRKDNSVGARVTFWCEECCSGGGGGGERKGCRAEFMWADGSFPTCGCGGGKSRIRMAKKGANSGKWFFACWKGKGEGECGFFQWANAQFLEQQFGPHLTPLK
ncbi:hypothetical protein TrRE_jg6338 [Triparma retinervis]|uniref:GRF-type domain-containing protein n=1 Tax=Triparma retinervis TaxID=2557542 RepID=A0A9W6ZTI1_9STRA|nr:hypothetical protein TrRE_jg6338 [Triparma retinervis]